MAATLNNSALPDKGHCACKFSSGGVLSKTCEFHRRLLESEREKCAKVCERIHTEYGEHPEMALTCAAAIREGSDG